MFRAPRIVERAGWVAVAALLGLACSPYVARGSALYDEGRYIEAAEVFERTEPRLPASSENERAEYALYRGLTFLELGDRPRARQWLARAYRSVREQPGTLTDEQRRALADGWERLGTEDVARPPALSSAASALYASPRGLTPSARRSNGQRSLGSGVRTR